MSHTGTISKLNTELNYGFIKIKNLGDVFFSEESIFSQKTSFSDLSVGQLVRIEIISTERGLFAKTIQADSLKSNNKTRLESTI